MLLDGAVSLCEFLVEGSFSGSGCGALISCLCTKRVALSRSPSEDVLCLFWSSFIYLFFFGCCWCWCWEGLQSKKKATHSHTNANRRQQSKDSQSGLFFRRRLCISEQREQRAARAPLSRGCLPVASSPCAKVPHFPAAVCWSWDCVMVWIFEPLKNTHRHSERARTLFDQREHVVSLPSPVAWNHFPQEQQHCSTFCIHRFQSIFLNLSVE